MSKFRIGDLVTDNIFDMYGALDVCLYRIDGYEDEQTVLVARVCDGWKWPAYIMDIDPANLNEVTCAECKSGLEYMNYLIEKELV